MTEHGRAAPAPAPTADEPGSAGAETNGGQAPRAATRWMQRLAEETAPTPPDGAAGDRTVDEIGPGESPDMGRPPLSTGLLLLLGLLWLAATMWSAHATIGGSAANAGIVIGSAALALPVVIAASLLAGAAAGLAAADRYGRGAPSRLLVGIAAGALTGAAATVAILIAYGSAPAVVVLAITVGAAGALGGAAALMPPPTLAAGIAGTLGVFVVGVVASYFQSPLKSFFGAGDSVESQFLAAHWLSFAVGAIGGLVAGVIAYVYLRRRATGARWPSFLIAGATAGNLLLLAEALTMVGGARLLDLVGQLSVGDHSTVEYLDATRLRHALVVSFVGGIVAMIAVGRTLRRPDGDTPGDDTPGGSAEGHEKS